ncbi:MAG: hypothetical protein ABI779_21105 [Acidobacteriota bacterium]
MKALAATLLGFLAVSCATTSPPPVARDSDEFQIEATVLAVYNVLSGPAGRRDWKRFEALFAPGAQMIVAGVTEGVPSTTLMTPTEYIARATPNFTEHGWFERPIATRVLRYGDIAHVWSTYEAREAANAAQPMARGINSIEMVRIGTDWKVQTLLWQKEDAAHPIPRGYLPVR